MMISKPLLGTAATGVTLCLWVLLLIFVVEELMSTVRACIDIYTDTCTVHANTEETCRYGYSAGEHDNKNNLLGSLGGLLKTRSPSPPAYGRIAILFIIAVFSAAALLLLAAFTYSKHGQSLSSSLKNKQFIAQSSELSDNNNSLNRCSSNTIHTLEELREVLPSGLSGRNFSDAKKVISHLDDQMIGFIERSPFLQLSTIDSNGFPFISPKGDEPGFVTVVPHEDDGHHGADGGGTITSTSTSTTTNANKTATTLIIPDRPGNRLIFGLQNILNNPNVGILFEIPGTCTTLRCGGTAHISNDLHLLHAHVARRCQPKVVLVVNITYAFFHCAKSYMRSRVWEPSTWPSEEYQVQFGRYYASKESIVAKQIDENVQTHYDAVQRAILGECEDAY